MNFSSFPVRAWLLGGLLLLTGWTGSLRAQADTNLSTPGAMARAARTAESAPPIVPAPTNFPVATPVLYPAAAPEPAPAVAELAATPKPAARDPMPGWLLIGQLLALAALGGFLAYDCGLTRARNCGHTCTVLLAGVMFGVVGYWMGGFAMQNGGLGDAHAALPSAPGAWMIGGLDHELGIMTSGHHWGFMGSAGFFLGADAEARNGMAALFLGQAILLALGVAIAIGGMLERVRLLAMAISSFLVGALIYPLFANWVWGGGWLAELGREFGMGHGVVDLAGAGVIHLTGGTLALVFTLELGPRYGRFGRNGAATAIPGHNVPFTILGAAAILLALTAVNAVAYPGSLGEQPAQGLAATNTLLGAAGGLIASFFYVLHRQRRVDPARLCRGLIGGAVAVSAGSALLDPWAALLIGLVAAACVQGAAGLLERRRIDDPAGTVAVHGAGGAWGLVAVGLFANGTSGLGINGVAGPVHGLLTGHGGGQLLAQLIGGVTCIAVVFGLGYGCVSLLQKIVGLRVDLADETAGLDFPKLGVLGYQADAEPDKEA